jgi:hypothetical protein
LTDGPLSQHLLTRPSQLYTVLVDIASTLPQHA